MHLRRRDVLRGIAGAVAAGTVMPLGCVRSGSNAAPRRTTGGLRFAPLMTLRLEFADAQAIGAVPCGTRTTFPIAGGAFDGVRLRGKVLSSGSSWTLTRSDEVVEFDMRVLLGGDDGRLIHVAMQGVHSTHAGLDYFRTISRFEAASTAYAFLNRVFAVGTAEQRDAQQIHSLDEVL